MAKSDKPSEEKKLVPPPDGNKPSEEKIDVSMVKDSPENIEAVKKMFDSYGDEDKIKFVAFWKDALAAIGHPWPEQPEPETVNPEDEYAANVKKHGPGFVKAQKKGTIKQQNIFSAHSWKNLGPAAKDGSKEGWLPVIDTPPEVKQLQTNKEGGK